MNDSQTQHPPSRNSSDSDVVGFANQPYEDPPPPQADKPQPEPAVTTTERDVDDLEAARTQPPAQNGRQTLPPIQGYYKRLLSDFLSVIPFVVPWAASIALSWSALTRVELREAPTEVLISCIASILELGSTFAMLSAACCFNVQTRSDPKGLGDYVFKGWIIFILLDPVVTGAIVWNGANKYYSCADGDQSPRCRVGKSFVTAIGVYRTFGVLGVMFFLIWLQDTTEKYFRKTQEATGQGGD